VVVSLQPPPGEIDDSNNHSKMFSSGSVAMWGQSKFGAVLVAIVAMSGTMAMAQTEGAVQEGGAGGSAGAPHTPWGHPDLQGVWTSGPMSTVPFERAKEMGTRAVLNDEEFAKRVAASQRDVASDREPVKASNGDGLGAPSHWNAAERGKPSMQASLIVDPPNGRLPELTEDGARRARRWKETAGQPAGPEELNPYDRCITRGVLGSAFPNIYNSAERIFQTPEDVVIHHEMIHETRIIPVDGRPHRSAAIRSYMGDSRAHWEGSTLVVDTTNFNGQTGSYARNGNGNPTSEQLHLTERYTLTDPNTLQYEVRVDDPETFTAPWTVAFPLTRADDYAIYEYACHEGNYALVNILSGARETERNASQEGPTTPASAASSVP
jgi:hypothetical protein